MPLVRLDLFEGRKEDEIVEILDTVHEAIVDSFDVPYSDRYQIVTQHKSHEMIIKDTGLDLTRTKDFIMISITTSPRKLSMKQKFYELVTELLSSRHNMSSEDIMINYLENNEEDWSFGQGVAQYIKGDL